MSKFMQHCPHQTTQTNELTRITIFTQTQFYVNGMVSVIVLERFVVVRFTVRHLPWQEEYGESSWGIRTDQLCLRMIGVMR
jgi:hypothetical protein